MFDGLEPLRFLMQNGEINYDLVKKELAYILENVTLEEQENVLNFIKFGRK